MKRVLLQVAIAVAVFAPTSWAVFIPLDQQINIGALYNAQSPAGDAIYPAFNADTITFESDGVGFARHHITDFGGWWYQYVDLNLAGITTPGVGLDLTSPQARVSFEVRFFHDAQTNTNPYADAPVFLRLYTYASDGNTYLGHCDYSIVYGTQAPFSNPPYPTWTFITVDVNAAPSTTGGVFDMTNVSRLRWYGTNWTGHGDDFVDFRNLDIGIVPEPSTALVAILSGLIFARPRRQNCR